MYVSQRKLILLCVIVRFRRCVSTRQSIGRLRPGPLPLPAKSASDTSPSADSDNETREAVAAAYAKINRLKSENTSLGGDVAILRAAPGFFVEELQPRNR